MEITDKLEYNENGDIILATTKMGDITTPIVEGIFELMDEFDNIKEFKKSMLE